MQMNQKKTFGLAGIALAALLATASAAAEPSGEWRLKFDGASRSDGVITVRITPVGGTPILAEIRVVDEMSENGVAEYVRREIGKALPKDRYEVERDDGEEVVIKKIGDVSDFEVEILSNTVEHVEIELDSK